MRIPYIVGRWVQGRNHYGRERLIEQLLEAPDSAIWLVGTRRMGKTSLLRQLEMITSHPQSLYVPLFWDLQGCQSPRDLADELFQALVDVADRLAAYHIDVQSLAGQDAVVTLRTLARLLDEQGKRLLVLIDEAEVLIEVARQDPAWVGRLRKVLQDARLRTILTSTKLLAQLNQVTSQWSTSPFLFGFSLVNLTRLEDNASRALVRQTQGSQPVIVPDGVVDDVLVHTNGQPYLIQYLCQRLFENDVEGRGRLRLVTDADLATDHILAGFFQNDYQHLSSIERRLLLTVADLAIAKESELLVALSDLPPHRIQMFLYGLERLGYLRRIFNQWAVGNEYLRRWVLDNYDELIHRTDAGLDEGIQEKMLEVGRQHEVEYLRHAITRIEAELAVVDAQLDGQPPIDQLVLLERMDQLRKELARLRMDLASIAHDGGS